MCFSCSTWSVPNGYVVWVDMCSFNPVLITAKESGKVTLGTNNNTGLVLPPPVIQLSKGRQYEGLLGQDAATDGFRFDW